jgi:hypothetical protein
VTNAQSGGTLGTIYYAPINLKDGTITGNAWVANGSGPKAREKFTAVSAGGYVLVSGGLYNGSAGSSEQEYSSVNTDGSVASFNGATGVHTISKTTGGYNFYNQSTAYFADSAGNAHVLIIGGEDVNTGNPHAESWYQH